MFRFLFIITLGLTATGNLYCQKDTLYFDEDWEICAPKDASFYRTWQKERDHYIVKDWFMSGKIQMVAQCSSVDPLIKNGYAYFFDEDGEPAYHGAFQQDKYAGYWSWYDPEMKDSAVAKIMPDGQRKYLRINRVWVYRPKDIVERGDSIVVYPGGEDYLLQDIANELGFKSVVKKADSDDYIDMWIDEEGVAAFPKLQFKSKNIPLFRIKNFEAYAIGNKYVKAHFRIPVQVIE